jgi:hypothetical protein
MGLVEHNASFTFDDVNSMTGRPKFIVRHSTIGEQKNWYVTIDTSKTHSNSFSLEVSTVTYCTMAAKKMLAVTFLTVK